MGSDDLVDWAHDRAMEMLDAVGDDFSRLPPPVAHFLRVHGAQGIIDNGGYRYFFESDWVGQPDYAAFVDAYRAIGCTEQAEDLRRVVATFGFDEPHLRQDLRNAFIEEHFDNEVHHVPAWGDALCGDTDVWDALENHVKRHAQSFSA